MNLSNESYTNEFERNRGSIYTQTLNETVYKEDGAASGQQQVKMVKQRTFLRSLRFGFIKDSYNKAMSSSSSQRKITIAMYAVPAVVAFGLAVSNYAQQSFGVYLKYQALVDSYYLKKKGGEEKGGLAMIQDSQKLLLQ